MKGKIGVWIDLEKAIMVSIEGDKHSIKTVPSAVESRVRYAGEGRQTGRFGSQFVDDERAHDHRREQQLKKYLKQIVAHLSPADQIVVFGPGTTKVALRKVILEQPILAPRLVGVETTHVMTENQLVAWVKDYFHESMID